MRYLLILLLVASVFFISCSQQEGKPATSQSRQETPVIVPKGVAESWKAVKVVAIDLATGVEQVFIVDVGGEFTVSDSDLVVKVRYFLPAFVRDGKIITSASDRLDNPAVMIRVTEQGTELFNGWLFGLYPDAHNFRHPRFGFRLAGQVPAQKKG